MTKKKIRRKVNKFVADFNKNIEKDEFWKGRFVIRQVENSRYHFSDNSGDIYHWRYRIIDKKTGVAADYWFDNYNIWYRMWDFVNNFIVEVSGVWLEIPRPSYDSPSYIDKPVPVITEQWWYGGNHFHKI